ncbi:MAG: undecaprenyl-phosphate glucose phosphotransferase [Planctomycetes bacterium]|nr:undecaprenyl-phosphate glucose phosphotransferase [Planctomycetota bacterium]
MLRERARFFRSVLIATDTTVVSAAAVAAYFVRWGPLRDVFTAPPTEVLSYDSHAIPVLTAAPIMLVVMLWTGLYVPQRDQRFYREAGNILRAVVVGVGLTFATISFFSKTLYDGRDPSRFQYVVYALLALGSLLAWRYFFRVSLRLIRRHGWNLRHVAIIGTGRLGQVVYRTLRRNSWTGINPAFFVSHHPVTSRSTCLQTPVLSGLNDLEKTLERQDLSGVFIALPGRMAAELPGLLARLERFSVDVRVVPDMNPRYMPMNMAIAELDGMPVLSVRESPLAGWGGVLKRGIDITGSLIALTIFAVPMLVIALLVRLSGPGPVVFRQERMSLNGQRFEMFKFRTMAHASPEERASREARRDTPSPARRDDRVTRVGRFLRRTSLDELPQFINVLRGDMSLVGPRPEVASWIPHARDDWRGYMLRQNVKSGITGWAQVNGLRGDTSLRKRLQYDLFYIRNWSIMLDLRILWMTLFTGFTHPNAS